VRSDGGCAHHSGERRRAKLCLGVVRDRGGGCGVEEGTGGDLDKQWRHGGFQIERPSGGFVRALGRKMRAYRGVYMGGFAWQRGKEIVPNRGGFGGDFPGAHCVHLQLPGRDDRWDLHVGD
jgi:hypothetical protein